MRTRAVGELCRKVQIERDTKVNVLTGFFLTVSMPDMFSLSEVLEECLWARTPDPAKDRAGGV
jgi:hypothetical protein